MPGQLARSLTTGCIQLLQEPPTQHASNLLVLLLLLVPPAGRATSSLPRAMTRQQRTPGSTRMKVRPRQGVSAAAAMLQARLQVPNIFWPWAGVPVSVECICKCDYTHPHTCFLPTPLLLLLRRRRRLLLLSLQPRASAKRSKQPQQRAQQPWQQQTRRQRSARQQWPLRSETLRRCCSLGRASLLRCGGWARRGAAQHPAKVRRAGDAGRSKCSNFGVGTLCNTSKLLHAALNNFSNGSKPFKSSSSAIRSGTCTSWSLIAAA